MGLRSQRESLSKTALVFAVVFPFMSGTAIAATESERVDRLEKRLQNAISVIETLQDEIQSLKKDQANTTAPVKIESSLPIDITERLEDVENVVFDLEEKVGSRSVVNAFDAKSLDIGGFLHQTYTYVDGEEGSESSFNRTIFELLVKADVTDDLSAFFATAFIREGAPSFVDTGARSNPNFVVSNNTPLVIGWGNWAFSDAHNLKFGRFITPHGIVNIDHFPAILLDPEQPQFLRPFGGDTIFPNFVNGVQYHGKQFLTGGDSVSYNAYVANHQNDSERLLYGARAEYSFNDRGIKIGVNGLMGERADTTESDYTVGGIDFLYDKGTILWKNEVFITNEDDGGDRLAYYTQPAYRFNDQWVAFYRHDFLDDGQGVGDRIENVIGLNYLPTPRLRLRATATNRHFEAGGGFGDADAQLYQMSATLSF